MVFAHDSAVAEALIWWGLILIMGSMSMGISNNDIKMKSASVIIPSLIMRKSLRSCKQDWYCARPPSALIS